MITLSKTGLIYTDTLTQEMYKAENVFQVIAQICKTEKLNCDLLGWQTTTRKEGAWIIYDFVSHEIWQLNDRKVRVITIVREV